MIPLMLYVVKCKLSVYVSDTHLHKHTYTISPTTEISSNELRWHLLTLLQLYISPLPHSVHSLIFWPLTSITLNYSSPFHLIRPPPSSVFAPSTFSSTHTLLYFYSFLSSLSQFHSSLCHCSPLIFIP